MEKIQNKENEFNFIKDEGMHTDVKIEYVANILSSKINEIIETLNRNNLK